ncbi:hypothetical protein HGRIS_002705 [Hohenbuehelia grisea]|uniref:Homoserine O-acetyltransferase n=1 Tax=Hohenbuehelia grisea TaxID=104357 RepID=A0ABR3JLA2_9AGAR
MAPPSSETKYFHHGRFRVAGGVLPDAITAYRTYGDPKNPCIVFPTCYGGKLDSQLYKVGEDKALDPRKYFVVTFALFSNGEPPPYNGPYFPEISYEDNIRAQHAVLTKELGVQHVLCAVGFSMGGQQWSFLTLSIRKFLSPQPSFPPNFALGLFRFVGQPAPALITSEGPKAALLASKDFNDGHYKSTPELGIRAFARVDLAFILQWYRQKKHLHNGTFFDLNSFIREHWENRFLKNWDANDMLTLLNTWQKGDISLIRDRGDFEKALGAIKAKGLVMPGKTDLYFTPEDNEYELTHLKNSKLVVINSVWGHFAGNGANPDDDKFMQAEVKKFLEE